MKLHRLAMGVVLLAGVLALGVAFAADAPKAEHPVGMGRAKDCAACHEKGTPEIFKEWFSSSHGLFNVKCVVCHGSVGEDFAIQPSMARCVSCHADQLASMSGSAMKGKTCFTCHPAHALTPHGM